MTHSMRLRSLSLNK
ncbi:leader peptide Mef(F)L (plasmid) [Macrococcoides canis]|uniref:Leader peptide Mef(F)L n=1 Tax=Macrococcoides caseolyticum TaxID=69966 RepID=A0A7S4WNU2_9STAP|nr:leader peptide Mef(F)L [Macrococcus canis]DAC85636.1 TPA_asm: leader peptide Mef(F)L [Macrococcus caseolyticus]